MSEFLDDAASGISPELAEETYNAWCEEAIRNGIDVFGCDPDASLEHRIAWAKTHALEIGTIYTRYSTKMQGSTESQIKDCLMEAARKSIYVPPELICADEAISGRKDRRPGLTRLRGLLASDSANVLLIYKLSRLFRKSYEAIRFLQEELVETGKRGICVSQNIDTADEKGWKIAVNVHGITDELFLDATADHVRSQQQLIFGRGWITGAVPVGFRAVNIPDAPTTNRGLPRKKLEVDPKVAGLMREHARLLLSGMTYREGHKRWLEAGGPCDPRSTTGRMTVKAYRNLWTCSRLTGRFEYGRKRNRFSSRKDYTEQIPQPDEQVLCYQKEELRILDDETFHKLQALINERKNGPQGPRQTKPKQLWDLATECFYCASCSSDGNLVGCCAAGGPQDGMACVKRQDCELPFVVRRETAVKAICDKLVELLQHDEEFIEFVAQRSSELDAAGDDRLEPEIAAADRQIERLTKQINDLYTLVGGGSDEDRLEMQGRIQAAQAERSRFRAERSRLQRQQQAEQVEPLTPDEVRLKLAGFRVILEQAAAGELGEDGVYDAYHIFKQITGGQILVHAERRPNRDRTSVRGVFRPQILQLFQENLGPHAETNEMADEVSVWLRKPPKRDQWAPRVHQLMDVEGKTGAETYQILQQEGYEGGNPNTMYLIRQRYWEMRDEQAPSRIWNSGPRPKSS